MANNVNYNKISQLYFSMRNLNLTRKFQLLKLGIYFLNKGHFTLNVTKLVILTGGSSWCLCVELENAENKT